MSKLARTEVIFYGKEISVLEDIWAGTPSLHPPQATVTLKCSLLVILRGFKRHAGA